MIIVRSCAGCETGAARFYVFLIKRLFLFSPKQRQYTVLYGVNSLTLSD